MIWEVEFTDEFEAWWHTLSESEQGKVDARVGLLMERGPNLGLLRMLHAFDPRRTAILLVAGDKSGDDRWYEKNVPLADRLFDRHLRTIEEE